MKSRGYRSFPGFLSAVRDRHIAAGFAWTDLLERARRRYTRSTQRGIGPQRQSLEVCPKRLATLDLGSDPLHEEGPISPKHWATLCAFHMLRGAESSAALASHLSIDPVLRTESFVLPKSKTDTQGRGCVRTWGCVCVGNCHLPGAVCPYNAAVMIRRELTSRFGGCSGIMDSALPLFPTSNGLPSTRAGYVATLTYFSDALHLNPIDILGRNTIGEHVWRVSGSRLLARANVPLTQIALMARWGSDIILRYVAETPLDNITSAFSAHAASSSASTSPSTYANAANLQPVDDVLAEHDAPSCSDDDDDINTDSFALNESSKRHSHRCPRQRLGSCTTQPHTMRACPQRTWIHLPPRVHGLI
jgi:hypothetical protein